MAKSLPFVLSLLFGLSHGNREAVSASQEAPSTGMKMMQVNSNIAGDMSEAAEQSPVQKPYSAFMDIIIKAMSECSRHPNERCDYMNKLFVEAIDDTPTPQKFQDQFILAFTRCEKGEDIPLERCETMRKVLRRTMTNMDSSLLQVDSDVVDKVDSSTEDRAAEIPATLDHFMDILIKMLELCDAAPTARCAYMKRLVAHAVDDTPPPEKLMLIFIQSLNKCSKSDSDICTFMLAKVKKAADGPTQTFHPEGLMQVDSEVDNEGLMRMESQVDDDLFQQSGEREPEDHFIDIMVKSLYECEQRPGQRCSYMLKLLVEFIDDTPYAQRFPHILAKVLVECDKNPSRECGYMQRMIARANQGVAKPQ